MSKDSLQLFLGHKKMAENSEGLYPDSPQTAQILDLGLPKILRCRGLQEMRGVVASWAGGVQQQQILQVSMEGQTDNRETILKQATTQTFVSQDTARPSSSL